MTYRTLTVGKTPIPVVIGRATVPGQDYTLANFDLTNSVWMSTEKKFDPGASDSIAIPPLGSAPLPSNMDTYVVSAVAAGIQVGLMPGTGGWSPSPAQVSAQINALGLAKDVTVAGTTTAVGGTTSAVGGVTTKLGDGSQLTGLVANPTSLYSIANQTLTQGTTTTLTPVNPSPIAGYATCNQMGYELNMQLIGAAASTADFVAVVVTFFDDDSLTAIPIDIMQWYLPVAAVGSGGPCIIIGKGPQRGFYCQITVQNPPGGFANAGSVIFTTQFRGVGRTYLRDDWREAAPLQSLGGGNAVRAGGAALPGSGLAWGIGNQANPVAVGIGASIQRMLPLYSGRVIVRLGANGLTTNQMGFHFYPQNIGGNAGAAAANPINETFLGATSITTFEYYQPHDMVNVSIQNNSGVAGSVFAIALQEEY